MRRTRAIALVSALLAACSVVDAYPAPSAEICTNGIDDDFDGLFDCDDLDCTGQCTESSLARCGNGRDDDGDGRLDWADAQCWRFAHVAIERCPITEGTTLDVAPSLGDWSFASSGNAESITDPADATSEVVGVRGEEVGAELRAAASSQGGWDGATFAFRYYGDGTFSVAIEADGPAGEVWAHLDADGSSATVSLPRPLTPEGSESADLPWAHDGWTDVTFTFAQSGDRTTAHVTLTNGASEASADLGTSVPWPRSGQIVPWALLGAGRASPPVASGTALLGAVRASQPRGGGCADTPSFEGALPNDRVTAATRGPNGLVLVDGARAWRQDARGLLAPSPLELPSDLASGALGWLSMQWDEARGTFRGIAISTLDGSLVSIESSDGAAWRELGAASAEPPTFAGADPSPYAVSYTTRGASPPAAARYEEWVPAFDEVGAGQLVGLVLMTSSTGEPGTFAMERTVVVSPAQHSAIGTSSGISVALVGDDHVFFFAEDEATVPGAFEPIVHAYVEADGSGVLTEMPALEIGLPDVERSPRFGPNGVLFVELPTPATGGVDALLYVDEGGGEIARLTVGPPG